MNRAEIIEQLIGPFDVGDLVEVIRFPFEDRPRPIYGRITNIYKSSWGVGFEVKCIDAAGNRFIYGTAGRNDLEEVLKEPEHLEETANESPR